MVKKKSPIIPLTFVVIGVAVAFAVNTRLHPVDPKDEAAQAAAQEPPKEMNQVDKTQEMKGAMAKSLQQQGLPGAPRTNKSAIPEGPHSVMVGQKPEPYKPRQNSSATNAEWYTNR